MGGGAFFFHVGGAQGFVVRTGGRIRPMDIPVLPGSRRLLGTAVDKPNLGQKPKLGGVRALLLFSLYLPLVLFYLFEVFACSSLFFQFAKTQKDFSFLLLSLNLKKPKKMCFLFYLVCFVSRVQLESVMIIISHV